MKKLISFILSLILILSLSACSRTKETGITGTWYSDMYSNVLTMSINEGGIYNMELMDDAMIGTWVLEDNILYLDKGTAGEMMLSYDADAQTVGYNGFLFLHKKIKAFKPGKTIKANMEDFTGSWMTTKIHSSSAALPLKLEEFCMNAAIEGSRVILAKGSEAKEVIEGEAVFADGGLHLTIPAADTSGKESVYTITMLKSGMISIDDGSTVFYLEKGAAEN